MMANPSDNLVSRALYLTLVILRPILTTTGSPGGELGYRPMRSVRFNASEFDTFRSIAVESGEASAVAVINKNIYFRQISILVQNYTLKIAKYNFSKTTNTMIQYEPIDMSG